MAAGTVRVRAAFTERSNGQMILGPPKSRAGLRTVSVPAAILPDLDAHLTKHTRPGPDALVFTGIKGGPLRRSGFNKLSGWPHVVTGMGLPGPHFHDLRHAGNTLAADMGLHMGAGDGNRTRTISLGIVRICALTTVDLGVRCSASDRD